MISAIIPVYNETENLIDVVDELKTQLFQTVEDFEIIVVDDGSNEQTKNLLKQLKHEKIQVIANVCNQGYGYSLKKGINHAKFESIFIIDADSTYPLSNFKNLYEIFKSGYDLLVASRGNEFKEDSFIKSIFRRVLRFIVEFTSGNNIPDVNSGMRFFKASAIKPYFNLLSNRFSFTTSMTLLYSLDHKLIHFEENGYNKRSGKTKVKLRKDIFRTLQIIVEIIALKNPLKLHLVIVFVGFLMFIFTTGVLFLFNKTISINLIYLYFSVLMVQSSIAAFAIQKKQNNN